MHDFFKCVIHTLSLYRLTPYDLKNIQCINITFVYLFTFYLRIITIYLRLITIYLRLLREKEK